MAGVRSGKTSFGPLWLHREMVRMGPGDYLIAAPTYPLIDKAAGPEVKSLFERRLGVGEMIRAPWQFRVNEAGHAKLWPGIPYERESRILFGHANDPDSMEAMTVKAAWLDECGQKNFRLASWEAIQTRLSIDQGRVLLTTRPYDLGWLKQKIHDPWEAAGRNHPEIDLIRFDSTENPAFPREEWERARRDLPRWKFDMWYRAIFTRPAGLIYDCFDDTMHKCPHFTIPKEWPRYLGLDFGGVNTAGVFFAAEPGTRRLYAYREYKAGSRTAKEHVEAIKHGEPSIPVCVGGSKSEGQWRDEFRAAGLPVREPKISEVEVGIDRVYGAIKRDEIMVFDDLSGVLDELASYSRELDDVGNPTEKIADKASYHFCDAVRYALSYLRPPTGATVTIGKPDRGREVDDAPEGVFDGGDVKRMPAW